MKKNISKHTSWGNVADWYSEHLSSGDTYHETLILPNLMRLVGDVVGKRVLDLACGTGFFSRALAEAGAQVTGVDIAPELIAKAKNNLLGYPTSKFVVTPAHDLSQFESNSFDVIINILAIDNIAEISEMLLECARVLKRDGSMHIVFNHPVLRIPGASSWDFDQKRGVQYRRLDKYMSESKIRILMNPGSIPPKPSLKLREGRDEIRGEITTTTFHRPLQTYFKYFAKAGLAVTNLEEWVSNRTSEKGPRRKAEDVSRKEFPLFIYLRLQRG